MKIQTIKNYLNILFIIKSKIKTINLCFKIIPLLNFEKKSVLTGKKANTECNESRKKQHF